MRLDTLDSTIIERAKPIKLLVLDVDGVMTNGQLMFTNQGDEIKAFNSQDGHGIKMLISSGIEVAIITGRSSDIVSRRAQALGIKHLIQGREDKLPALKELLATLTLDYAHIAYMGDDYPDLPVIRAVGLGTSPANGHWVIKEHSQWISDHCGGEGAVRQLCDLLMLAQARFEQSLQTYL